MHAPAEPASVRVLQRVELCDTDVTGHYHHSTVIRWVESAEQTLLHRLCLDYLPVMPRVNYSAAYKARLWRHEVVQTRLRVSAVGRTSLRYQFDVTTGGAPSVEGVLTVVKVDPETGATRSWSDIERKLLLESGEQEGDFLARFPALPVRRDPSTVPMPRPAGDRWGIGFG
ncbi:acyl-CoA thioesterase [Actinomadura parmotrematis]|uniref:Acyl-CoA thioesterase n=1 Tax=Actinomadura parmotrematis TaxID=2864039 RepID=A0ABS7G344_9ACTN|nr:hypothetical protein [Actinomadura parmotrematis]MBW8487145.1 hypothetical protein [Actinomadura parmotrematis]